MPIWRIDVVDLGKRNVMLCDLVLRDIYPDLLVMLAFIVLFFMLNVWALRKYRAI